MINIPSKQTKLSFIIFSTLLGFGLTACNEKSNYDFDNSPPPVKASPTAAFSPTDGGPTTNNLLINPFTGKINIPNPADPTTGKKNPVRSALNTLDGFSTIAPITTTFGTPLDPTSLTIGSSIRIFRVSKLANGAVTGVLGELNATDITAVATGDDNKTLALLPLKPLSPKTTYMIILTTGANGIKDNTGTPITPAGQYLLLRGNTDLTTLPPSTFAATATQTAAERLTQATQIQALIGTMEAAATAAGVDKSTIALSWSFTTQSITDVLQDLAKNSKAGAIAAVSLKQTTKDISDRLLGLSDVYVGTLEVPYYLTPPSQQNPLAALTEYWPETLPANPETLTIPLIMTIPNAASGHKTPATGWPIAIYQHGITRVRTDDLIHADSLAQAGFATIAIDLPLHGITDISSPLHAANTAFSNDTELTFDLDLIDNTTNAPGPDGNIDPAGTHFINLTSLLTSRDNIRQGVSNLLTLRRSLGNIPGVKIDTNKVGFIAHSLGGFIGVPYLAVEDKVTPTSLITTGGGIAQLVNGSATRGPTLRAGLAAAGLTTEAQQAQFLGAAQTILDAADPMNFAALAASKHPIHMIEVVGDGTDQNLPDQTVPNLVPPLAGTEPMAALMGLQSISSTTANVNGIVRFTQGQHETLLTPKRGGDDKPDNADLLDVFIEMHTQIATFLASSGTLIKVTDDSDIQK
jgi:pimeloyl-ACP methyl ester carboxylesterase